MTDTREEKYITLTVPHELRPGDRYDQPHWNDTERWLVIEVDGQRLTVVRWSYWYDRFKPRLYRLLHPGMW
jgi:hypothetical protein